MGPVPQAGHNAFRRLSHAYRLFPFFRSTVGFDRLIGLLESASEQGYPPYNIERSDENNYRVTLAVAGFAEKDLSVDVKDRVLTVTGKREEAEKPAAAFLHQGIAGRAFERQLPAGRACRGQGRAARKRPAACRP